jgi:hypothetical protein
VHSTVAIGIAGENNTHKTFFLIIFSRAIIPSLRHDLFVYCEEDFFLLLLIIIINMRAIQYDCSRDDWPGKQWHNVQHVDPSARFSLPSAVSISIKENPSLLAFNYYFLRYNIVCKYRPTI